MKRITILILLTLTTQLSFGQACGIYRIKYAGSFIKTENTITNVSLPTTIFLHGFEKENSDHSYIDTTLTNGNFEIEISSHLTTPYSDISQLLSFYKKQSNTFKMKVSFISNETLNTKEIEVSWGDIMVSIIEDGKFGTLFEFRIKEQNI